MKIDVERAEDFVISGAQRILADGRIDYLILEMHAGGRSQALLSAAGYRGFLISDTSARVPVSEVEPDRFADYLFVRPGLEPPAGA